MTTTEQTIENNKPYVTKVIITHTFDTYPELDYLRDTAGKTKKEIRQDNEILAKYNNGEYWDWIIQAKAYFVIPKALNGHDVDSELVSDSIGGVNGNDKETVKVYDNEELADIKYQCKERGIIFPDNVEIEVKELWE